MAFKKLRFVIALLGVFIFAAAAGAAQKATSTTYRVRIRAVPGLSGKIVGYLSKGESVTIAQRGASLEKIDGRRDYWYQIVNSSGVAGWVFGGFLDGVAAEPGGVPVSGSPPPKAGPGAIHISTQTTESCGMIKSFLSAKKFDLKTAIKHGSFINSSGENRNGCQIFINDLTIADAQLLSGAFDTELARRGWAQASIADGPDKAHIGMRSGATVCIKDVQPEDPPGRADIKIDCFDDSPVDR